MIAWVKNKIHEWRLERHARKWLVKFEGDVQMLYRIGYDTDHIVQEITRAIAVNADMTRPDMQRLLRNLPRMVRAHHPNNPSYLESVP